MSQRLSVNDQDLHPQTLHPQYLLYRPLARALHHLVDPDLSARTHTLLRNGTSSPWLQETASGGDPQRPPLVATTRGVPGEESPWVGATETRAGEELRSVHHNGGAEEADPLNQIGEG